MNVTRVPRSGSLRVDATPVLHHPQGVLVSHANWTASGICTTVFLSAFILYRREPDDPTGLINTLRLRRQFSDVCRLSCELGRCQVVTWYCQALLFVRRARLCD